MTAIIWLELLLLGAIIFCAYWFGTKKFQDMQEWRARKSEIAHLLQEREETEKEVQTLRQEADSYFNKINQQREESANLQMQIVLRKEAHQDLCDSLDAAETAIRALKIQEREQWLEQYKIEQEKELQIAAKEFVEQFNAQAKVKLDIGADIAAEVDQLKKTAQAAIEVAKIREAERTAKDFYRLQIDEPALEDIRELRDVMSRLNQPEVLGKLIWKVYYEKPYTDLCGRVFSKPVCGIYLITNLENNMCYVGQAVNVQDRWRQHIKRAIGAETPTQNKLYPAMAKFGVENFTFQLIEEVTNRKLLDEREDYWQDFYKAKEFGYSIK